MAIDSKRIAKNTIFLYARLILVFGVSLYTSRVVLDKLGVTDYAIYNVVYSAIGMLSFLNATLSSGTSRFITFELGVGNKKQLQTTFGTALISHVLLALFILLLGETIGLWYAHHVMVIPPERMDAALIVYQISIAATIITILQVPFTSEIMAHERMGIYAYIGIYEALAKLLVVYLLTYSSFDHLVFYACLQLFVVFSVLLINIFYCRRNFEEVTFRLNFSNKIFKSILKFSGWNIIANMSNMLMTQGVIMLFNLFFLPVVVAAQAISNQISSALMQFVNNVRQAVNPQVIKLYANGQYEESKRLTFTSAEYIFVLLLLMGGPCIMIMPALLDLWLVEVPDYAVAFARLVVVQDILGNFSAAFYTPMIAANKLEKNTCASVVLCVFQFVLLYILFKLGLGPLWARYTAILSCVLFSFVVKPYILWKDIDYQLSEIYACIGKCMKIMMSVVVLCVVVYILIPQTSIWVSLGNAIISVIVVLICAYIYMERQMKIRLKTMLLTKIGLIGK